MDNSKTNNFNATKLSPNFNKELWSSILTRFYETTEIGMHLLDLEGFVALQEVLFPGSACNEGNVFRGSRAVLEVSHCYLTGCRFFSYTYPIRPIGPSSIN